MNKFKKIAAITCIAMAALTVPASAATTSFTLTVTKDGQNQNPISKRTEKAGGSRYEKKCYVTTQTFSGNGSMLVQSVKYHEERIKSGKIILNRNTIGKTLTARYTEAPENKYYYLKATYGSGLFERSLNATGRYTP